MPSSTTGDIIWRWTDPKTVELTNIPPPAPPPVRYPGGASSSDETKLIQEMLASGTPMWGGAGQAVERTKNAPRTQKRQWRKQIDQFLKSWDASKEDQSIDIDQGIQEMLDSGAVWQEDDGVYTSIPLRSAKKRQAMVKAVEGFSERQAEQAPPQYPPNTYAKQQQDMQLMQNMGYNSGGQ